MAGPVPTYIDTQTAAQNAFHVSFGLLTLVNSAIANAAANGQFNVIVDCSLFSIDDVMNLRVYLDSLGYDGQLAKDSTDKSVNITWNAPLDIDGGAPTSVTIVPSATGINIFARNDMVPSGVETTILSYTTTFPFHISQLFGWGNVDAEFFLRLNGVQVGGGISSPSIRTLDVDYEVAPIPTSTGDVVLVTALQVSGVSKQIKVNLLGE